MSDIHALQWRHNGRAGASNHQPHDCLLDRLFRRRSKKTSKLRVTDLCAGNSPVTGEFPTQRASNTENVSIWWRHHKHIGSRGLNKMADICWRYFQSTFLFGQIFIQMPRKFAPGCPIDNKSALDQRIGSWLGSENATYHYLNLNLVLWRHMA